MEWKLLTPEETRNVYERHLRAAFPRAELRPLSAMERLRAAGRYEPWGLTEKETLLGAAFLWLGEPGWYLCDYLCVPADRRGAGLGAELLRRMRTEKRDGVLFGEAEEPDRAPDPAMARRRLAFYRRCGARVGDYEAEVFGVRYRTVYWADRDIPDGELAARHAAVYRLSFTPENFRRYVRIPCRPDEPPLPQIPWEE